MLRLALGAREGRGPIVDRDVDDQPRLVLGRIAHAVVRGCPCSRTAARVVPADRFWVPLPLGFASGPSAMPFAEPSNRCPDTTTAVLIVVALALGIDRGHAPRDAQNGFTCSGCRGTIRRFEAPARGAPLSGHPPEPEGPGTTFPPRGHRVSRRLGGRHDHQFVAASLNPSRSEWPARATGPVESRESACGRAGRIVRQRTIARRLAP